METEYMVIDVLKNYYESGDKNIEEYDEETQEGSD